MIYLQYINREKQTKYGGIWLGRLLSIYLIFNLITLNSLPFALKLAVGGITLLIIAYLCLIDKVVDVKENIEFEISKTNDVIRFIRSGAVLYEVPVADIEKIWFERYLFIFRKNVVIQLYNHNQHAFRLPIMATKTLDKVNELILDVESNNRITKVST